MRQLKKIIKRFAAAALAAVMLMAQLPVNAFAAKAEKQEAPEAVKAPVVKESSSLDGVKITVEAEEVADGNLTTNVYHIVEEDSQNGGDSAEAASS